jgi:ribosomal protein L11
MAWFLALQGPSHTPHQSMVYELQDGVDVDKIAQELVSSATLDRVVPVPVVLTQNKRRHQKVTLYIRPAAWGLWSFYELSDEDRREMAKNNQVVTALAQAAAQQRAQGKPAAGGPMTVQVDPLTGQVGPASSGPQASRG